LRRVVSRSPRDAIRSARFAGMCGPSFQYQAGLGGTWRGAFRCLGRFGHAGYLSCGAGAVSHVARSRRSRGHPIESHVATEPQAWDRIPPAGLLVDPGVGHLEPRCANPLVSAEKTNKRQAPRREDVVNLHQTCRCFGPGGACSRVFRLFEIPRHAIPFPAGGRHNGASTRAINRRRGAGSSGFAGTRNATKSAAGNFVCRYGRKTD